MGEKVNEYVWAGKTYGNGKAWKSYKRKLKNDITTSSFCSLSYDKSIASFKANSPQRAI
jgi:hypothetical protein